MATARKKGTCVNCERPDMYLPSFGRCFLCYEVVRKAKKAGAPDEVIEAALANVRERIKSGKNLKSRSGRKLTNTGSASQGEMKPREVELFGPRDVPPAEIKTGEGWLLPDATVVSLEFRDERDKKVLSFVEELAKEARRNPDQQILWMLQDYMDMAEKLTEAARA